MRKSHRSEEIKKLQAERIKECMVRFGITGKELAEKLNYSQQHISYILNGKRNLTTEMAITLADFFNTFIADDEKYYYAEIDMTNSDTKEDLEWNIKYGLYKKRNGTIFYPLKISKTIDYRYLLCETNYASEFQEYCSDKKLPPTHNFFSGIFELLMRHGYFFHSDTFSKFALTAPEDAEYDLTHSGKGMMIDIMHRDFIENLKTEEIANLTILEAYKLLRDIENAIVGIISSAFNDQKLKSKLEDTKQK